MLVPYTDRCTSSTSSCIFEIQPQNLLSGYTVVLHMKFAVQIDFTCTSTFLPHDLKLVTVNKNPSHMNRNKLWVKKSSFLDRRLAIYSVHNVILIYGVRWVEFWSKIPCGLLYLSPEKSAWVWNNYHSYHAYSLNNYQPRSGKIIELVASVRLSVCMFVHALLAKGAITSLRWSSVCL